MCFHAQYGMRYYLVLRLRLFFFFFQAEDGIRDKLVTGVQTCALPISPESPAASRLGTPPTWPRRTSTRLSLRETPRPSLGAVQRVEGRPDRRVFPDEDRGVSLRVAGGLAVAEPQHQVHEVRGLVAFERGHELLVVDPERVGRVVVNRRKLFAADAHVLVHRPRAVLHGERVPGSYLDEW